MAPISAECSHRKGKETGWTPQLHVSIAAMGWRPASGPVEEGTGWTWCRGQDPDLGLYW